MGGIYNKNIIGLYLKVWTFKDNSKWRAKPGAQTHHTNVKQMSFAWHGTEISLFGKWWLNHGFIDS